MKTVIRDLVGKSVIYGLGSSLNGLAGFVLIPFFMKRLTAVEYGRYALAEMLLNLLVVLLGMGMNVALLSRWPRVEAADRREFVGSLFSLMLITTLGIELLFSLLMLAAGHLLMPGVGRELFLLVSVVSALETIWLLFATLYRAEGAAWRFISASLIQVCGGLVATVVMIVKLGMREEGILYGRLTGDCLVLLFLLPHIVRYHPRLSLKPARDLLKIGLPLVPATFASIWVSMSPRYFVEWFGSTADVGMFAMSSKIAGLMSIGFVQPFAMAWMVAIFKIYQRPDAQRIYARILTYYLLVGGVLALSLGIAAPQIAALLGKKSFPLSPEVITLMALAYVASGLMYPINIGPYVKESTRRVLPVFALATGGSLVFGCMFTLWWGVRGAAIALLSVYAVQNMLLSKVSNALYPFELEWRRIVKTTIALSGGYTVAAILLPSLGSRHAWLPSVFFPVVVAVWLIVLGFFDQSEVQAFKSVYTRIVPIER